MGPSGHNRHSPFAPGAIGRIHRVTEKRQPEDKSLLLMTWSHQTPEDKMSAQTQMEPTSKIPQDISTELRRLAHDLSNSLETIMQASYLLSQSKLDETSKRWAGLIDNATRDAARINREVREILRSRST